MGLVFVRNFLLACLLFSGILVPYPASQAQESQPVKIGLIYPLTGPMSSFGEDMAAAIPLLEKKFNSEQNKYRFKLILEDGKFGHSNASITAAKKLVAVDGVRFLVVGSSGEILQIAPFVESSRVVAVAGFASHPDVRQAGDYIFRTYIDAARGILLVASDMKRKRIERVAVITEESSFTVAIKQALEEYLGEAIVFAEEFTFGDSDYKSLIAKARGKRPQAYYLNISTPDSFITLVQQLRANGVDQPLFTYYTPSLKDVQEALGAQLNGTVFLDFPEKLGMSEDFKHFLSTYTQATGGPPRAEFNFRTNYNAAKVLFDAISAVGPDPDRVKAFLYDYDRPSATGRLQFDENGDAKKLELILKTFGEEHS